MRWTCVLVGIAAFFAPAAPVCAQADVLQVIPDDAIGFIVVNRVGQTNDKIANLARRLKLELPGSPLELVTGALGVDKGLAKNGTLAIAGIALENDEPKPLVFVPVDDYKAFINQLQPQDPKEGISAITLKGGNAMLAGKRGNFAVLADAEDRALLMHVLKANQNLATWAEPLVGWLAENDAAGVWTARGIKVIGTKARKGIDEAKQGLGALPPEAQVVGKVLDGADNFVKSAQTDVAYAGFGVRIDQAGNVHITKRAQFVKGSGFAKAGASIKALPAGPLAGLPSGPFVMAMGGALPENAMQSLMNMNLDMLKASGQNLPEETLKKMENTYAAMMKGVSGMGFVWQTGKEGQPLFACMAGVMHTDDAAAYMTRYEKSIVDMNEVVKGLNLPQLPAYELKKVKVNGTSALEMRVDFGAGLGIPEPLKNMFGPDGKMTVSAAARDNKTVVIRYTAADGLKDLLGGQDQGLGSDAGVAQASKGLPAGAQWAFYFSPKGTTEFAAHVVKTLLPIPLNIPQFAATPPVAVGAKISGQGFEMHTVIPAAVVDNVSEFVDQLKRLFRGVI